jgi:nucleoside phosphorylase
MAKEKKVVAVEMEGGGAAAAIHNLQEQAVGIDGGNVGFLMIRGVSDLVRDAQSPQESGGQREERKSWTELAADAAARFAAELVRRRWPVVPRE